MTDIKKIEREVESLSDEELAAFREWFAAFDAAAWDRRVAADVEEGALDKLAGESLADHRAGRSKPL